MGRILGGGLQIDVATMVAWSLKKKEAEKKADPKASALPFYKRFTRKQTLLGLLIFSLNLSEASHQHELGQSQTMEDLKKSTNRGNLNFLKVPQTKRPRSIHARSS